MKVLNSKMQFFVLMHGQIIVSFSSTRFSNNGTKYIGRKFLCYDFKDGAVKLQKKDILIDT